MNYKAFTTSYLIEVVTFYKKYLNDYANHQVGHHISKTVIDSYIEKVAELEEEINSRGVEASN